MVGSIPWFVLPHLFTETLHTSHVGKVCSQLCVRRSERELLWAHLSHITCHSARSFLGCERNGLSSQCLKKVAHFDYAGSRRLVSFIRYNVRSRMVKCLWLKHQLGSEHMTSSHGDDEEVTISTSCWGDCGNGRHLQTRISSRSIEDSQ